MLFWMLQHFAPLLERLESVSSGDSRVFLTARAAAASLTSFLVAWWCGPLAIDWLKRNFRERIDSDSARLNQLHAGKKDTPTMGGLFIVGAIVAAALLWADWSNRYVQLAILVALSFGLLGAIDDWIKIRTRRNGLTPRQKFWIQFGLSAVVMTLLYFEQQSHPYGLHLISPIGQYAIPLDAAFIAWGVLVLVGSSNGVNLTDGLDGLAGGCLIFAGGAFMLLTYLAGHRVMASYLSIPYMSGAGELSIVFGAMVGAVLGFLWYNCHPAQVFMGDTGSLPTGALLGLGALVIRQELTLLIVGGVFVIETLSVLAQVFSFKMTGKRVLACSPLHNHYLFQGEPETRIVVRFWIGAALLAVLGLASLKIR